MCEKAFQQLRGVLPAQTGIDLGTMEDSGLVEQPGAMFDRPALGIRRRIVKTPDARMRDCASTHGARLKRYPQVAIAKTVLAKRLAGSTDRDDLGMCGRIVGGAWPIMPCCYHCPIAGDNRPYRHLTRLLGKPRLRQRFAHEKPCLIKAHNYG